MSRYRHYRNSEEPGQTMFITTTVLDFVHVFLRNEPRDQMVLAIAQECKLARAVLHAYVVMPHHIHILLSLHSDMNVLRFMQRFKPNAGRTVSQLLTLNELAQFNAQRGLNRNTFWQRSFRSVAIDREKMFWEKVNYIHLNPVHAEYVERAEDYRWSSARLFQQSCWTEEEGLPWGLMLESLRT